MKAELSQPTLGLVRRVLEETPTEFSDQSQLSEFWRDALFDFGFAPAIIDILASYDFGWSKIIPAAFVGKLGLQNSYFSNALALSSCDEVLKRLTAFALFHSKGLALGDQLRKSLRGAGFDLKSVVDGGICAPEDVRRKLNSPLSAVEVDIVNAVLQRFIDVRDSTARKPLNVRFGAPEVLERLVRCCILMTHDQGQHYLPQTLAFHYSGNTIALEFAKKSAELVLEVLRDLYKADPDNSESQFSLAEIKACAAQKQFDKPEDVSVELGLYLLQEFSGVLAGWSCNTQGIQLNSVRINENIIRRDIRTAWDEHIEQRSQYIERDEFDKRIARSQQTRKESMPQVSKPTILVLISHSSKDAELVKALIELLRAGLGLLATQIRCSSVDGYRLPAGVNSDDQLRKEIADAVVLVGVLTPNSLSSTYVLFELGARWGIQRFMIPLLAGVSPEEMRGPQRILNALECNNEAQLIQFVEDAGRQLEKEPQSSSSYLDKVRAVKRLADLTPAAKPQIQESLDEERRNQIFPLISLLDQPLQATLKLLSLRSAMTEMVAIQELQQFGFEARYGLFEKLRRTTNLVRPVPGQPPTTRPTMNQVWEVIPENALLVRQYFAENRQR